MTTEGTTPRLWKRLEGALPKTDVSFSTLRKIFVPGKQGWTVTYNQDGQVLISGEGLAPLQAQTTAQTVEREGKREKGGEIENAHKTKTTTQSDAILPKEGEAHTPTKSSNLKIFRTGPPKARPTPTTTTTTTMPGQPTTDPMPTVDFTSVMLKPIQRLTLTMLDTMDTQAMLTVALPHTAMAHTATHPMLMADTTINFSKILLSNLSATCMQVLLLNKEDLRKCPYTMHSVIHTLLKCMSKAELSVDFDHSKRVLSAAEI